jgi:hypothetical protein
MAVRPLVLHLSRGPVVSSILATMLISTGLLVPDQPQRQESLCVRAVGTAACQVW